MIQVNFYPTFLDSAYGQKASDLIDAAEEAQDAWLANPSDPALQERVKAAYEAVNAIPRPSYKKIVDHIDHVVKLVGVKHVGLGSDFDGIEVCPSGLEDISRMQKIIIELRKRGYSEYEIRLIAGGNFLHVMDTVQHLGE